MKPYIFSSKNKIHIIDIRETIRGLIVAKEFLKNVVAGGEDVLFVGTKYQARELLRRKAEENDVPYVVDRWLGGTLTNFKTIRSRLNRLEEIEQWEEDGTLDLYSKKEQSAILREKRKLIRNLGGIRDLDELPGAMVVIDPLMEEIAVSEANREDIPIVALIDTDGDPSKVDVPVPCNDEAMRVIDMMVDELIAAVKEGQEKQAQIYEEQQQKKQQEQKQQSSSDEQQQEDTSSEAQNESDRSEDEGENSDAADASDNAEPSTPAQEEEATA